MMRDPILPGSNSRLTEDKVKKIKKYLKEDMPMKEIAEKFGISRVTVSQIKCRRVWRHVEV